MSKILQATHEGQLNINDSVLDVAVLEDGTRIINETAIFTAFSRQQRGNARQIGIPAFMDAQNLQPFISSELKEMIKKIQYKNLNGKIQQGYNANIIPLVADLYLIARENGVLRPNQLETAQKAEIVVRALSKVGMIALVDEATGYQYDRNKLELQKILSAYVSEEILHWQLMFTKEFYKEMFRLWNIPFVPKYIKTKPSFIGKLTTKYIYDLMPMGVVDKIKEKIGKTENGNYRYRWHQGLTPEIGQEHLKKQIHEVTALMSISNNKRQFEYLFQKKYGISPQLELIEEQ